MAPRTRSQANEDESIWVEGLRVAEATMNRMMAQPGYRDCPRYTPQDFTADCFIGGGKFGLVFKATHTPTNPDVESLGTVSIKRFSKQLYSSQRMQDLLKSEKKLVVGLDSAFVVKGLATFRDPEAFNMVMEYAPFGCFTRVLLQKERTAEELARCKKKDENVIRYYMAQLILGLQHIHTANFIHGDLKPDNILVFPGGRLKIGDFGFAKKAGPDLIHAAGTQSYMAPEIFHYRLYTCAVDWWALGVIFWLTLHKVHPYATGGMQRQQFEVLHRNPIKLDATLKTKCSDAFVSLVEGLLAHDASSRLGSTPSGVDGIKNHDWFKDFDFLQCLNRNFEVPNFNLPLWEKNPEDPEVPADFFQGIPNDPGENPDFF